MAEMVTSPLQSELFIAYFLYCVTIRLNQTHRNPIGSLRIIQIMGNNPSNNQDKNGYEIIQIHNQDVINQTKILLNL